MKRLELPFNEAVEQAARQNYYVDRRRHNLPIGTKWKDVAAEYLEEARAVLKETGENYLPEYGEPHIVVKKG